MKKFTNILFFALLLPTVFAITWPSRNLMEDITNAMAGRGEWPYDTITNIFFFVFIPFWASFVIFYGVLLKIQIFPQKKINLIIALLMAMSFLYYGALTYLISVLHSLGGLAAVIAFFIIFIYGVYKFGRIKEQDWKTELGEVTKYDQETKRKMKELKEAEEELRIVREDMTDTASYGPANRLKRLKEQEQNLQARVDQLRREIMEIKGKRSSAATRVVTED